MQQHIYKYPSTINFRTKKHKRKDVKRKKIVLNRPNKPESEEF